MLINLLLIAITQLSLIIAKSSINSFDISCYNNEADCLTNCSSILSCVHFDECNGETSQNGMYTCLSDGILVVVLVFILICLCCCACCCIAPCVIISKCRKKRRELRRRHHGARHVQHGHHQQHHGIVARAAPPSHSFDRSSYPRQPPLAYPSAVPLPPVNYPPMTQQHPSTTRQITTVNKTSKTTPSPEPSAPPSYEASMKTPY